MKTLTVDAVRAALAAATPGPWEWDGEDIAIPCPEAEAPPEQWKWYLDNPVLHTGSTDGCYDGCQSESFRWKTVADAELAAMAPDLAADWLRLRAEVEELREKVSGVLTRD